MDLVTTQQLLPLWFLPCVFFSPDSSSFSTFKGRFLHLHSSVYPFVHDIIVTLCIRDFELKKCKKKLSFLLSRSIGAFCVGKGNGVAEMNGDSSGKGSSSCLAITEKKNQRTGPGGCIGIFYQLFDWNRRLTKKKLFSKKLLTPARAKQASSKKFIRDEKMPNSKLHLIANENGGGFPSAIKGGYPVIEAEQKHEMRVPGLVARLMGVEPFIPSQQDKSKKASFYDTCGAVEKEPLGNHSNNEAYKDGVDLETSDTEHDLRPQKLQKSGTYERMAVTKFGAEALHIKSVLSRARKHNHPHHPKLASPLKNPRVTSGRSASRSSRLIGAATKILEPGLQATSRAKCSLTYSASIHSLKKNSTVTEKVETMSADIEIPSDCDASVAKSLVGHTSCQNCGNLLVVDCRPVIKAQPDVSPPIVSDVFAVQKGRSFMPFHEHDIVLLRSQEKKVLTLVNQEERQSNAQSCNESTTKRMPLLCEEPTKWNSSCQPFRDIEDEASSFLFKHQTQSPKEILSSEKISSGSRTSNPNLNGVSSAASHVNGTKDFVALNRSLSGRSRMRSPTKVDSSKFGIERKPCSRQDDSMSRVSTSERKRRTPLVEGTASVNSVAVKQRNLSSDAHRGKRREFNASSPSNSNVKRKQGCQQKTDMVNGIKTNDVVSFTFNSPYKQMMALPDGKEDTRNYDEMKKNLQGPLPLREDVLGAFLQQKLKELRSREYGKLALGDPYNKSTAVILHELISALTLEHPTCPDDHVFKDKYVVNQERLLGTSCVANHLSPGSVLEASFSSSSLHDSSGHGFFHPDSMNHSCDKLERLEYDADLIDSPTSFNRGKMGCEIVNELVNQIPSILQSLNVTRLTKSKLIHGKDVIVNAELVLGNATEHYEDGVAQLLISRFLFDELHTMACDAATWTDCDCIFSCDDDSKERRRKLKAFLFDFVIEYLESNCNQYYRCVFKALSAWTKLPSCMKAEMLVQEVKREIKKWACISGMLPDEIIEWEMSHSLGKWNDFNIEAYEAGVDIDGDVLQILVDEIVEDLVDSRHSSF
ncbi:hypothetical protein RIF29_19466 [Crotalaria pallida]|uniref:DUF4378 domain-containing protein n=1 Tax=Crotalaria pallida TaxID=3830 RepID=A0AAN9F1T3_CROPI